ncbi:GatB/YqeY domain-containing protein [soil metagenome]
MTLSQRLQADLTQAIRDRDELRRDTLRMAVAAAYNQAKAARRDLSDDEVAKVLAREVKTRRESVDAYSNAGRTDAAQREQAEIEVLARYLPTHISDDEVAALARDAIAEVGATSPREMGRVMAALMPRVAGRADGKLVSSIVARELARRDLSEHGH